MKRPAVRLVAVMATATVVVSAGIGPKDPISGEAFDRLIAAQDTALQTQLAGALPEAAGFVVTGPLGGGGGTDMDVLFDAPRVLCATGDVQTLAVERLRRSTAFRLVSTLGEMDSYGGHKLHGSLLRLAWSDRSADVLVLTQQANRWLIWWRRVGRLPGAGTRGESAAAYASAVAAYLDSVDAAVPRPVTGSSSVTTVGDRGRPAGPPQATDYGLPVAANLLPPRPEYVIQGYQNYRNYLHAHADIETWFADGILAFVPSDSLLDVLARDAPAVAWPNKEAPLLQHEFEEYFERGGNLYEIKTLTSRALKELEAGEYLYVVGLNGRIRFAPEMPRERVKRIEAETGRRVPRANHAFLFPGEPVLTAGAFFVACDPDPRIVEVNTHSGHYFYSNITRTIREDISRRSDQYLMTIGHFFNALDRAGIPYTGILVSKM